MHKVRVIPVLLLKDWGLEKSIRFDDPVYIGSPINAARVFNGRNVDELILLDIVATDRGRGPILEIVSQITEEAFMPVTIGGGIRSVEMIRELLYAGAGDYFPRSTHIRRRQFYLCPSIHCNASVVRCYLTSTTGPTIARNLRPSGLMFTTPIVLDVP